MFMDERVPLLLVNDDPEAHSALLIHPLSVSRQQLQLALSAVAVALPPLPCFAFARCLCMSSVLLTFTRRSADTRSVQIINVKPDMSSGPESMTDVKTPRLSK